MRNPLAHKVCRGVCARLTSVSARSTGVSVATPSGGVVEQITPGVTGLLSARNDADSLAVALREALATPGLVARLGRSARQAAGEEFSEAVMVARHLELYEQRLTR